MKYLRQAVAEEIATERSMTGEGQVNFRPKKLGRQAGCGRMLRSI